MKISDCLKNHGCAWNKNVQRVPQQSRSNKWECQWFVSRTIESTQSGEQEESGLEGEVRTENWISGIPRAEQMCREGNSDSQPVGHHPFGVLIPSEDTEIYIMIRNSSKITVMK